MKFIAFSSEDPDEESEDELEDEFRHELREQELLELFDDVGDLGFTRTSKNKNFMSVG